MKIKEYNQMKAELIKDDRGDSTGAFRNFVREQRALDQEPRTMELAKASSLEEHAGGGMVGIRKPSAIPPKRQGLRSIMINGKKS